jgi:hypothetical protein
MGFMKFDVGLFYRNCRAIQNLMSLYVNTSLPFCVHLQFAEATHHRMCIIKTWDSILLGFDVR